MPYHERPKGVYQMSAEQNITPSHEKDSFETGLLPGYTRVIHSLEPVYDRNSRILILGSFPSVRSREQDFYYGHPQNRFWKLMERLLEEPFPPDYKSRKDILLLRGIALWDVIRSCDIKGSSDQSIRNVVPMDLNRILKTASIRQIITNGSTAHGLYMKYCREQTGRDAVRCPSTSPANAAFTLDRLAEAWAQALLPFLRKG